MLVDYVLQLVRIFAKESNPYQLWSNEELVPLVDLAQRVIVREINAPESRYIFDTVSGAQEYQVPEMLQVKRVYVQGQRLPRSDIATLEGDQIGLYDETGQGGGPAGSVTPGSAPVLAGGQFTSQWTSQLAQSYPVSNPLGYPAPVAAPWFPGRRPIYYFRPLGLIGFVPAPAGVYPVVVDCVLAPRSVTVPGDNLVLPTIAADAMAWKVIEYMMFGNADANAASDQRNYAQTQYMEAMKAVRGWARGYDGSGTKGPKPLTYRSFYTRGNNRNWGFNN